MPRAELLGGELDGLEIHHVVEGRGPVTLLIHGLGGFAESWRHTTTALARHGTVIALDLPGFGISSKPRRAYELSFLARAVEAFLLELGVDRVSLVGHSLGGAVAVAHALMYPARLERLALISAAVPGFPLRPSLVYRLMAVRGMGELISSLITPRICAAALERCFVTADLEEVAFFVGHQYSARASAEGRAAYLSMLRAVRADFTTHAGAYRRGLAELRRPIALIHGREDRVIPARHAEAVAEGLPAIESRWLDRCGHFPQIEHASVVNTWLGEFLYARASSGS